MVNLPTATKETKEKSLNYYFVVNTVRNLNLKTLQKKEKEKKPSNLQDCNPEHLGNETCAVPQVL